MPIQVPPTSRWSLLAAAIREDTVLTGSKVCAFGIYDREHRHLAHGRIGQNMPLRLVSGDEAEVADKVVGEIRLCQWTGAVLLAGVLVVGAILLA